MNRKIKDRELVNFDKFTNDVGKFIAYYDILIFTNKNNDIFLLRKNEEKYIGNFNVENITLRFGEWLRIIEKNGNLKYYNIINDRFYEVDQKNKDYGCGRNCLYQKVRGNIIVYIPEKIIVNHIGYIPITISYDYPNLYINKKDNSIIKYNILNKKKEKINFKGTIEYATNEKIVTQNKIYIISKNIKHLNKLFKIIFSNLIFLPLPPELLFIIFDYLSFS